MFKILAIVPPPTSNFASNKFAFSLLSNLDLVEFFGGREEIKTQSAIVGEDLSNI